MFKSKLIFILLLSLSSLLFSQDIEETKQFVMFPKEYGFKQINYYLGLSMTQLPTEIVEDVFDQVPMIDFKVRYGLPFNFSANGGVSSNVFTNLMNLGCMFSLTEKNLSLSIGNDVLLWYGFLKNKDFNVSVFGWGYSPSISSGYNFQDFLLSAKFELNFKAQNTYMRAFSYTKNAIKYVGFNFSVAVEQPLWKDNYFIIGFRGNYTKFFYKSWLSFSTFDEYLFYPEFFAGFIL